MKFKTGDSVLVSLPLCKIDGEVHKISIIYPQEFMKYEIRVGDSYYLFAEHDLSKAEVQLEIY